MEIELKYSLKNEDVAKQIREDQQLIKYVVEDSDEHMDLNAIYFDTEDHILQHNYIAYRIRQEGDRNIATLKWSGTASGPLHKREELNINLGTGDFFKTPDINVFSQSEIGERVQEMVGEKQLKPMMKIRINRHLWRLEDNNDLIEVCIDKGQVETPMGITDINEIEVELLTGDMEHLMLLGEKLAEKYELEPEKRSKFERGLALLGKINN